MKTFLTVALLALFAGKIFAGDIGSMMKQKARGFGDNNTQQSTPAPSQPGQPPAPAAPAAPVAPPPTPLTPEQAALANVVADLNSPKVEASDKFGSDLMAMARGANKPSSATVHKLAKDLTTALAGKTLTPVQRSRMAQDLQAVLSGANVSAAVMDDIIGDVPSILKRVGADAAATKAVGDDLKAVNAEIKKKP